MIRTSWLPAVVVLAIATGGCQRQHSATPAVASRPTQAVQVLAERLHANDAVGFARAAVPPALHARLAAGWRAGHSRWPLDELPLDARLAPMLAALSAADAERRLQRDFERQFARADGALRQAATTLGLLGVRYVRLEGDYSDAEREHYAQAIQALSRWGAAAPLGDPRRARRAIGQLAAAARGTGIRADADFARLGMDESLRRLGPFLAVAKRSLADYGLDLDATLAGVRATLLEQRGDHANVRLQYRLGDHAVDAIVAVTRIDGRWYLDDHLRHAAASLQPAPPAPAAGTTAAVD